MFTMRKELLAFLVTVFLSSACNGIEYYVSPTALPNSNCPYGSICLTLNDYAINTDHYFKGHCNISLLFLNGTHNLNHSFYVEADTNNSCLSVSILSADGLHVPEIVIPRKIEFFFEGLKYLHFKHISISGNDLPTLYFTLVLVEISELDFEKSTFRNSSMNIIYPALQNLSSSYNQESIPARFTDCKLFGASIYSNYGSLMHFKSTESHTLSSMTKYRIELTKCLVHNGSIDMRVNSVQLQIIVDDCNLAQTDRYLASGSIVLSNSLVGHHEDDRSHVSLFMVNTTTTNSVGSGVVIMTVYFVSVTIIRSSFVDISYSGIAAIRIYRLIYMEVSEATFMNCHKGAISIDSDAHLVINNSTFVENYNHIPDNGVGVTVACRGAIEAGVEMSHVVFSRNHGHADYGRVVDVSLCNSMNLTNALFEQNTGTSVRLSSNDLYVHGDLKFVGNTAYRGSGISLLYSRMYLHNDSSIVFFDNSASDVGGGIYVEESNPFIPTTSTYCFYTFPEVTSPNDLYHLNISLIFANNSATNGGSAIYGASVKDYCLASHNANIYSGYIYMFFFQFDSNTHLANPLLSTVTSDPSRVCICDEMDSPQCISLPYIFSVGGSVFPGENVHIPAVIVGKDFGTTTGTVFANPLGDSSIDSGQYTQRVLYSQCNILTFTVYSKPFSEFSVVLTSTAATVNTYGDKSFVEQIIFMFPYAGDEERTVMSLPVFVNYTVDDCPIGFVLSRTVPFRCECNSKLQQEGINQCVITNHTGLVYRRGSVWLGAVVNENESYQLLSNLYCPTGYCKSDNISINLVFPDEQCASNRSGLLCGKCQGNFSLSLGSSNCIECIDNKYVALILPFVFGVLILILVIKVLDLTVRHGTLNGIVFYANVVWAHRNIFFHDYKVVETFVGWLNLELGIDTCFIEGLDAFGKTVIVFGQDFVNVIGVTILIVLSAKYSRLARKLLGSNVVHVLATLFFLSYTRILQTITSTLSFHILEYPEEVRLVWSLDGNLPYFGAKHLSLALIALGALFVLWMPYTFTLLFFQCLQKKSHLKILRWTDSLRLKPYMDAYFGPLKSSFRYWFGLLLFARVVLVLANALSLLFNPNINLLAIITVTTILLCHPHPYESWKLSVFESLIFLNLIALSASVLLAKVIMIDKIPFVYLSVCIVLVQLCGVLLYHIYMVLKMKFSKKEDRVIADDDFLGQYRRIDYEEEGEDLCNGEQEPLDVY